MKAYTDKSHSRTIITQARSDQNNTPAFQLADNRPETTQLKKLQAIANNSQGVQQLKSVLTLANSSHQTTQAAQLREVADVSKARPVQKKGNKTGLPDNLKAGIENLSGHTMDDVKVHFNSSQPKQLNAHAYAQGTNIHVAPGQEKHLPHEAWHVVQQKEGRVKPTRQLKQKVNINDDTSLEKEADVMGAKAAQMRAIATQSIHPSGCGCSSCSGHSMQRKESTTQLMESQVAQLNCQHCGSAKHNNKNCPNKAGAGNLNHSAPVKKGKGERDQRKRKGHGMMSKDQAKRYVPGYR